MLKLFEKFTEVDNVKETILVKAVETGDTDIVDFFLSKGYKITLEVLESTEAGIFRHLLEKKAFNPEDFIENGDFKALIRNEEVQKALIDFGHDHLIFSTVGFNSRLKWDPKYSDIINNMENQNKFNM